MKASAVLVASIVTAGVLLSGAGASAFDLSIAQCQSKKIVALGRGRDVVRARLDAIRACVRKGGTRGCCEVQVSTHAQNVRHRGRTLCLAAIKGPTGVIGAAGSSDQINALSRAQSSCATNMGKDLPDSACKPYRTIILACRPAPKGES